MQNLIILIAEAPCISLSHFALTLAGMMPIDSKTPACPMSITIVTPISWVDGKKAILCIKYLQDSRTVGWEGSRTAGWKDSRMGGQQDSRMGGKQDSRMVGWWHRLSIRNIPPGVSIK